MGQIALHPDEASKVLKGYMDTLAGADASFRLRKGQGTAVGDLYQVHSKRYVEAQEVKHFDGVKWRKVIDNSKIKEDYPQLVRFQENPLDSDLSKDEAVEQLEELLSNPAPYINFLVTEDASKTVYEWGDDE